MKMRLTLVSSVAAALLANTAIAETETQTSFVLAHIEDLDDGAMTQAQLDNLAFVAHQATMAAVCDTIVLDTEKFQSAFDEMEHSASAEMTEEEAQGYHGHVLFLFGMAMGAMMAEASTAPGAFCADALEQKDDPDMAAYNLFE